MRADRARGARRRGRAARARSARDAARAGERAVARPSLRRTQSLVLTSSVGASRITSRSTSPSRQRRPAPFVAVDAAPRSPICPGAGRTNWRALPAVKIVADLGVRGQPGEHVRVPAWPHACRTAGSAPVVAVENMHSGPETSSTRQLAAAWPRRPAPERQCWAWLSPISATVAVRASRPARRTRTPSVASLIFCLRAREVRVQQRLRRGRDRRARRGLTQRCCGSPQAAPKPRRGVGADAAPSASASSVRANTRTARRRGRGHPRAPRRAPLAPLMPARRRGTAWG